MSLKFTGELCVMATKNDAKFEKELTCHTKCNTFLLKHSKISNICTLMRCFWPKYIMFEVKKDRVLVLVFDGTENWCKVWRKTDLCFQKWHEEFGKFSPGHSKASKLGFCGIFLSKVENTWP